MPDLSRIINKNKAKEIIIEKEIKADHIKEVKATWDKLQTQIMEH